MDLEVGTVSDTAEQKKPAVDTTETTDEVKNGMEQIKEPAEVQTCDNKDEVVVSSDTVDVKSDELMMPNTDQVIPEDSSAAEAAAAVAAITSAEIVGVNSAQSDTDVEPSFYTCLEPVEKPESDVPSTQESETPSVAPTNGSSADDMIAIAIEEADIYGDLDDVNDDQVSDQAQSQEIVDNLAMDPMELDGGTGEAVTPRKLPSSVSWFNVFLLFLLFFL